MKKWWLILICVTLATVIAAGVCLGLGYQKYGSRHDADQSLDSNAVESETAESMFEPFESETEKETETETETETESYSNGKIVALDPGHQSSEIDMSAQEPVGPGATETKMKATTGTSGRYSGVPEYELVLEVGLALRDELENRGYEVVMTREDNMTAISNKERAELAANAGADVLVRLHADGNDDSSVHGAMTMVPSSNNAYVADLHDDSYALGGAIINAYCDKTGMKNNGVVLTDTMSGINWSTIPVTILEMGYMTNESDDMNMQDEAFRANMILGIADGIDDYFGFDHNAASEGSGKNGSASSKKSGKTDSTMTAIQSDIESMISTETYGQDVWSVCVQPLDGRSAVTLNDAQMQAASLIKLYIMGAVYENYDQLTGTYGKSNIDSLLKSMITVSDNDAANTLTGYLGSGDNSAGRDAVTSFCEDHGYTKSSMGRMLLEQNPTGENYTSVSDCAGFLMDLYNGNYTHASDMINLLKQQERTGKIPAGVPSGVVTANKTGELTDVENDAALIYAGGCTYIMCVMTENLYSTSSARSLITRMSEKVYTYFK